MQHLTETMIIQAKTPYLLIFHWLHLGYGIQPDKPNTFFKMILDNILQLLWNMT